MSTTVEPSIKIADLHTDTILEVQGGSDLVKGNPHGHVDLQRLRQGGVGLQTLACFVSSALPQSKAFATATELLDLCHEMCRTYRTNFQIVETAEEAEQAIRSDKIAFLLAIENGYAIENDLKKLEILRRRGVRYMTITHSRNLEWALSSAEQPDSSTSGLSGFGHDVIKAMNSLNIIPDLSHVHERTFWEILKISRGPVIASHSNARTLCPTPRNLTDDQIKAIAGSGGMIGVNFFPAFLDTTFMQEQNRRCGELFQQLDEIELQFIDDPVRKAEAGHEFNRKIKTAMADVRVDLTRIVEHLGFGSDMDGVPVLPHPLNGCGEYPLIIAALQSGGFSRPAIEKICYKNFLRVLRLSDN
jgi:membrane dipeptidase